MNGRKLYYGWVIVAVSGITLFVAFGIRLSFTVFFVVLTEEFSWQRAETALIFSTGMIVFAGTSLFAGLAIDRWGARRVFSAGALLLAIGLWLSSTINTLNQLIITYSVIAGLGITILGLGPQAGHLATWFRQRLGLAIGLAFAATGLGTLILTPAVELVITNWGWQVSYRFLAGLALLLVPLILFFIRRPNTKEWQFIIRSNAAIASSNSNEKLGPNWTFAQAVKTRAFWLVIIAALCAIGPLRMLTVHQLAIAVGAGFDRLFAATVIGFSGAVTAVSFIAFGTLSDRIGRRRTYLIGSCCLILAFATINYMQSSPMKTGLIIYAMLLGFGEGSRSSLVTAVASDLFPGQALGTINGAVGSAFGIGAAFFPWLAGLIFDLNGSYTTALILGAVTVVISTGAIWLAPQMIIDKTKTLVEE